MHFDGAALLKASLAKLAELGLSSAKRVLLNGVGWGGTSVILNADTVGVQLKALAPNMADYRAVAADAIHPRTNHIFWSDKDGPGGNVGGKPYDALTGWLKNNYKLSNPSASLLPGCKAANVGQEWLCLYVNESLPFIKTPLYLVNQLASIWDTFCNIDGVETDDALQISCTPHGDFAIMEWHYCFQYVNHGRPRHCIGPQITYVIKPLQEQYVNETVASGLLARPGNGAYFHSCHSGGYWVSADGPKGEWNMISVDNVTLQQAVSTWWEGSRTATSTMFKDCYWSSATPFICNPVCATLPGPYSLVAANASSTAMHVKHEHVKTDDDNQAFARRTEEAEFPPREPLPHVAAQLFFAAATVPFSEWDARVRKPYATQAERQFRAHVYASNVATIIKHNRGGLSWTMGVNTFSDLTEHEFVALLLRPLPPATMHGSKEIFLLVGRRAANVSVDWRTKGAVTPVKNQRHCGACWAFGTTGSIEGANFLTNGKLISLSEQQLVDCSLGDGNKGCKGGDAANSYKYLQADGGLDTEADYPYQTMGYYKKGDPVFPCNTSKAARHAVVIASHVAVPKNLEEQLAAAILKTPTTVAVEANSLWMHYKAGVMPRNWCPSVSKPNHMILAVGLTDQVYIVKNSWGAGWGMAGYIQMPRNVNGSVGGLCGIASQASYAVVKKVGGNLTQSVLE